MIHPANPNPREYLLIGGPMDGERHAIPADRNRIAMAPPFVPHVSKPTDTPRIAEYRKEVAYSGDAFFVFQGLTNDEAFRLLLKNYRP